MAFRLESQAEPIPGYKLIERLGGGGFGEVWKAEAPGGLFKAIKFVYGDLQAPEDEDGSRAIQELKGLNRVKSVHHPFILSLERYDIIDGQLIIIMELADRTIWDRFRECRSQGLPGIPREELLGYMQETAEALDLMYHHYNLQHLDIKPQNLFLVFNHVKVADFGLAKDLEGKAVITVTGGLTPVYAAPETFDGWLSPSSDQYSLAIVYQELLTGQRPFTGTTIRQLVLQHVQGAPDLNSLLVAERPIIGRALSKNPDHRYPTCVEFIQAVRETSSAKGVAAPVLEKIGESVPLPLDSRPISKGGRQDQLDSDLGDGQATRNAFGRLPKAKRAETEERAKDTAAAPRAKPVISAVPDAANANGHSCVKTALGIHHRRETYGTGVLRPALVIGMGHTGLSILKQLRSELTDQFGHPDNLPNVRLLYVDTDPEAVQSATQGQGDALLPREVLLARLRRASHYLKPREGKLPYESWLDPKVLYRIPRQRNHAGARALGRLAFVDNQVTIVQRLETGLAVCTAPESLEQASKHTGLDKLSSVPRVYLVGSLAGGTGSGMFIDLAYVVRQLLRNEGHKSFELVGMFLLPRAKREGHAPGLGNTVAALTELNHFAGADAAFTARYDSRDFGAAKVVQEKGPPFQQCYLLPMSAGRSGQASPDLVQAGHFLFGNLVTPVGHVADHCRRQAGRGLDAEDLSFHTFGSHRIVWPRRRLLEHTASRLCSRLIQHWMSKDNSRVQEEIQQWAQEQWEAQGFRPETLISRQQELCEGKLQQAPEKIFSSILGPLAEILAPKPNSKADVSLKIAPVVQAVDRLEKLLGIPEEGRPPSQRQQGSMEASVIETALADAVETIAAECDQKLAELVVRLFEEPLYRLAGAEEAVRQLSACVQQTLESQEALLRELQERTVSVHQRLHAILETPTAPSPTSSTPRWRSPFTRRATSVQQPASASEFLDLLGSYAKCRYQSLILLNINALYVRLRGNLSDQMREVGFCRHRLTELANLIKERTAPDWSCQPEDHVLVPQGCADLGDYLRRVGQELSDDDILEFDEQIQKLVRRQYRALVQVCMSSSHTIRMLAPALMEEAESFLGPRLQGANVAELLLARYPDNEEGQTQLAHHLLSAYDEAAPELVSPAADQEVCIITVPPGPAGDRFRALAQSLFPKATLVSSDSTDEILFYRGCQHLDLSDLEQLGPVGQAAYRSATAQDPALLHSRGDITEWRSAVAVSQ